MTRLTRRRALQAFAAAPFVQTAKRTPPASACHARRIAAATGGATGGRIAELEGQIA